MHCCKLLAQAIFIDGSLGEAKSEERVARYEDMRARDWNECRLRLWISTALTMMTCCGPSMTGEVKEVKRWIEVTIAVCGSRGAKCSLNTKRVRLDVFAERAFLLVPKGGIHNEAPRVNSRFILS